MKRIALYGFAALFTFLVFMLVFAPAATLWVMARDDVARQVPDLSVLTVDGTVWSGRADIRYREFPPGTLTWDLSAASLLALTADVDGRLVGEGHDVTVDAVATRTDANFVVQGTIDNAFVNPLSGRYGLTFPGELQLIDIAIASDHHWLTAADGQINWSGGRVTFASPNGPQSVVLPPLTGQLSLVENNLVLELYDDTNILLSLSLAQSGWVKVDLMGHLLKTADLPFPASANPDAVILVREEKLF